MTVRHTRSLGERRLAPETLMMGYGYDPALSRRFDQAADLPDLDLRIPLGEDGKRFFEVAYGLRERAWKRPWS